MTEGTDPAAEFTAMMTKAAESAQADADPAPYGYTKDAGTGEMRPKKAAGRPRKPPSLDELKAERDAAADEGGAPDGDGAAQQADRPPQRPKRSRRKEPKPEKPVPPFREGQIERGVNRLYRKAGRIINVMDPEIGAAIIEATRAEDEDDITVGRAWEEVCRHNPAIRRVVMKFLKGGAYGQLFWAHAPILLAIMMKDAIRKHIPFQRLMIAALEGEDDGDQVGEGEASESPFAGVSAGDMQQAMAFAAQMFAGRGAPAPRAPEAAA